MRDVYLICLLDPNEDVMRAIQEEWGDSHSRKLNEMSAFVALPKNGQSSLYEIIEKEVAGDPFRAVIVLVGSTQGYGPRALWAWLKEHTGD